MAPYDDWNRVDDEEEQELQDHSYFDGRRDVILFAIDCSPSMLEPYDDPLYEDVKTCHLLAALDAAVQIQKRKVIVGPNDSVGIMLFNTTKKNEGRGPGADIKKGTFVFQPIEPISAPKVQDLMRIIDAAREDLGHLHDLVPPLEGSRVPTGDVFTSCNWILRDGAPTTATKRIFLITDEDDPHPGPRTERLTTSAKTTLIDLIQAGVSVEPFFVSTEEKPFDLNKFYRHVLHPSTLDLEEGSEAAADGLPESLSITRIDELLSQMRIHESPKRTLFGVRLQLGEGLVIGVRGYGLITEQKKGSYKYFMDFGDRMEVAHSKTVYIDEDHDGEVEKEKILYGMELGASSVDDERPSHGNSGVESARAPSRVIKKGNRVFYTAEEVAKFRTLGLEPGIKLLGFKDRSELLFEDNVKHSLFLYPDEMMYSGSRRTFTSLVRSMVEKKKIGICLALVRRNSTPMFCAMLPQTENVDQGDAYGIHLIPLPFADDIRGAPVESALRASEEQTNGARAWIDKLCVKNGTYPSDAYPNPSLAYHNAQLQASAFREEWDSENFEDPTLPKIDMIHKRVGPLVAKWKQLFKEDPRSEILVMTSGVKRKAEVRIEEAEVRARYEDGTLGKMTVEQLKEFLKAKSLSVSGRKAELLDRVIEWLQKH